MSCYEIRSFLSIKDFFLAIKHGDENKVSAILSAPMLATDNTFVNQTVNGEMAMHVAAEYGNERIIYMLLGSGALFDTANKHGDTPLHKAIYAKRFKVVKILLAIGANPNTMNNKKLTPFKLALARNSKKIALLFLKDITLFDICSNVTYGETSTLDEIFHEYLAKALGDIRNHVNMKNGLHETPLHYAALYGREKQVKKLVELGADVNARTRTCGATPFHFAVGTRRLEIVKYLFEHGANIELKTNIGDTPLFYAVNPDRGLSEKFRLLIPHWNDILTCGRYIKIVKFLLEKKASVLTRNHRQKTPLHVAALLHEKGRVFQPEIINILISHGADVNALCKNKFTPIFYVRSGDMAWYLICKGANVNHICNYRNPLDTPATTPLFRHYNDNTPQEILRVLLEHGANPNILDRNHNTLLQREITLYSDILETIIDKTAVANLIPAMYNICQLGYDENWMLPFLVKKEAIENVQIISEQSNLNQELTVSLQVYRWEIMYMMALRTNMNNYNFFDILKMSIDDLTKVVRNVEFVKLSKDPELIKLFPVYGEIIVNHIKSAIQRRNLCDLMADSLIELYSEFYETALPDLIAEKIVSSLTENDMLYFINNK